MDIQQLKHCKILVIGESCLDVFIRGEVDRLCPEVPAPVFTFMHKTLNPGMAANVSANLSSFEVVHDLVTNKNYEEVTKTRYVDARTNTLFIRVDENDNRIERCRVRKIDFSPYSAVIISDYCKGFLDKEDIEFITKKHPLVFLDTKKRLGEWCKDAFLIKINNTEFENSREFIESDDTMNSKIICTLGPTGCSYGGKIFPVPEVSIKDVSGAGDTFLASLVASFDKTKDLEKSILFANRCSTEVVQKRGVTTPQLSLEEDDSDVCGRY